MSPALCFNKIMRFIFLILSFPSVVLFFRFEEKTEIVLQWLIVMILLFLGWRIFKSFGCLKMMGLAMLVFGFIAYYFLIIQPFLTGKITTFNW